MFSWELTHNTRLPDKAASSRRRPCRVLIIYSSRSYKYDNTPKRGGVAIRLIRKIAVIAGLCLIFRIFAGLGADAALDTLFQSAAADGDLVISTIMSQSPLLEANVATVEFEAAGESAEVIADYNEYEKEIFENESFDEEIGESATKEAEESAPVKETSITGSDDGSYLSADGIYIKNATSYEIDIEALLNKPLALGLTSESPQVLIIHTHGSEAYTPGEDAAYEESDYYRTEDKAYSVIAVGDALQETLEANGVSVIHDRELYDYPSYVGSYGRSLAAIDKYLEEYPSIQIVLDLHRDALEGSDGTVYKTIAEVNGESSAQVMLVVGTDASGLEHPSWSSNLQLALRLQLAMKETYPGLARPIGLKQQRYNQHLSAGSLLVEVGSHGNTLREAISAASAFGECLAGVISDLSG